MKLGEIKELSKENIDIEISKSRKELADLRMKLACRQLEDSSLIKKKKKEIAHLLTVKNDKSKDPKKEKA